MSKFRITGCLLLILLGLTSRAWCQANSQPPLSKYLSLYQSGGSLIRFESTFVCGGTTCDLEYIVTAPVDTEPFSFAWKGGGFNFSGDLNPAAVPDRKLWGLKGVARPRNNPGKIDGDVTFSNVMGLPGGGIAQFYEPPKTPVGLTSRLDQFGDFINSSWSVEENPTLLLANSRVTWVAEDSYEYLYTVDNMTAEPVVFTWSEAGMSGTIDPNSSSERTLVSALPPMQIGGSANATIRGALFEGPTATITPVPEPSSLMLAVLGVVAVLIFRRRWK